MCIYTIQITKLLLIVTFFCPTTNDWWVELRRYMHPDGEGYGDHINTQVTWAPDGCSSSSYSYRDSAVLLGCPELLSTPVISSSLAQSAGIRHAQGQYSFLRPKTYILNPPRGPSAPRSFPGKMISRGSVPNSLDGKRLLHAWSARGSRIDPSAPQKGSRSTKTLSNSTKYSSECLGKTGTRCLRMR